MIERKLKILHFSIANTKSGVTQYILNQWKFIDRTKFFFDFVTFSKELDYAEELLAEGCKIHYVSVYAEKDEKLFCEEIRKIFEEGYDVVHLHTSNWSRFILEELAKEAGIPKIIIHSHSSDVHNTFGKTLEKAREIHSFMREQLNTDVATDFFACSNKAAEWLYGDSIPKEKVIIIKNAIDIDRFTFDEVKREQTRKELKIDKDFVIGHVGRFEYQKNHDFLIRFFLRVCKSVKDVKLILVGDGSLRNKIEMEVEEHGIKDRVIFLGKTNEVEKYYQAMDLFVLPSHFEGFCIAAIEAQTADLPCLISQNVDSETKIIEKCELLELDEELWYERTMRIYESKNIASRECKKEFFKQEGFDIRESVKSLEKLYLGINES